MKTTFALLLSVCLLWAHSLTAEENPGGAEEAKSLVPSELHDSAYDSYVDLDVLRDAWIAMDQAELAEIAEKLADGERKLGQPHKVATSKQILMGAARAALRRGDRQTLEKLWDMVQQFSWGETQEGTFVKNALQMVDQSRSAVPEVTINVNDVTGNMIDAYHDMRRQIETASITGDTAPLQSIAQHLEDHANEWPESLRKALETGIASARAADTEPTENDEMLNKLIGGSRNYNIWMFYNTNRVRNRLLEYQLRGPNGGWIRGRPVERITISPRHTYIHTQYGYTLWAKASTLSTNGTARICQPGNYNIKKQSGKVVIKEN